MEGKLVRNPVRLVKPVDYQRAERKTWTKAQVLTFLRSIKETRLEVAWRLSLYGLRRGEVLGLRWEDIDLKATTITIQQARVLCDYKVIVEPPKSRNGLRTLPADDELVTAFKALRKRKAGESEEGRRRIRRRSGRPGVVLRWRVPRHGRGRHAGPSGVVQRRVRAPAADRAARQQAHHALPPCFFGGALGGIRTPNLLIRSQMLYPLSYERSSKPR